MTSVPVDIGHVDHAFAAYHQQLHVERVGDDHGTIGQVLGDPVYDPPGHLSFSTAARQMAVWSTSSGSFSYKWASCWPGPKPVRRGRF